MRRKLLAVLLSIFVLLSVMPFSAFAMQIYVDITATGGEDPLILDVAPSDSIDAVKSKLYTASGVSVGNQDLYFGIVRLEEGHTLADYNIQKSDTVRLELRENSPENVTVLTWADLQEAMNNGSSVTLGGNIAASQNDSALSVPAYVSVTLNLNGYTIDRALSAETANGSVIIVNGSLTVVGTGKITGGNTTGAGGGVRVKSGGRLILFGGSVEGNHAKTSGGGVYVSGSDSLVLVNRGSVKSNTAKNGGGIAQDGSGSIRIQSGSISGNTASNNGGGVWYGGGSGSSFTMTGGSITSNNATGKGGAVYINSGTFAPEGGSISGNSVPEIGEKTGGSGREFRKLTALMPFHSR